MRELYIKRNIKKVMVSLDYINLCSTFYGKSISKYKLGECEKMKMRTTFLHMALFLLFLLTFTACGQIKTPDILTDIKECGFDLRQKEEFEVITKFTKNKNFDTTLTINEANEFEDKALYKCTVASSNSDFDISYHLDVTYTKQEQWTCSGYEVESVDIQVKNQISDEQIITDTKEYFNNNRGETVELDISTLEKKSMYTGNTGCHATVKGTVKKGILTKECIIDIDYSLNYHPDYFRYAKWSTDIDFTVDSFNWDVDKLSGKRWIGGDDGEDFIYIQSINKSDATMMVGYRLGIRASTVDGPTEEDGKPVKVNYKCNKECIVILTEDGSREIYPDMSTIVSGYKTYPN